VDIDRSPGAGQGLGTAFAVTSVGSVQFGAALAATLFPRIGPIGTVTLRLIGGALALAGATRPWRVGWGRRSVQAAGLFGLVLALMNVSIYLAIDRLPLATVITLEFLGPLGVAVATATSWRHRGWALPAGAGVALLGGSLELHDLIGVLAALTGAVCWASYILLSRRMGGGGAGLAGLCLATVLGAVVMTPVGIAAAGSALLRPQTLELGLLVGVLSSAVPYSLDLLALRRLPTAVFGVLTSLNPAVAALAGLLVLRQRLPQLQMAGIGLVILASGGITLSGRRPARPAPATTQPSYEAPAAFGAQPAEKPCAVEEAAPTPARGPR
jgi:inner membrane transporter RhtA